MFQNFTGVGRLTRAAEIKDVGDYKVAEFGVAINGFKDEVLFLNGKIWGKQAESLAAYTKSGDKILVEGELKEDKWEDKEGNKRSKIYLNAKRAVFLENKPAVDRAPATATTADIPF
jgi:single-strand DNA-binding protein|tara:strand:+ start:512 stop:862 length:351 start_codon:yes stop_codon:yes gene_type:complete